MIKNQLDSEDEVASAERSLAELLASEPEILNLLDLDPESEIASSERPQQDLPSNESVDEIPFTLADPRPVSSNTVTDPSTGAEEPFILSAAQQPVETTAETMRKSGLAWSAGIIFFGSVVFMLVIGWFADLLLGSSPWGLVGGIIVGSIIGFIQFFRINAAILRGPKDDRSVGLFDNDNENR